MATTTEKDQTTVSINDGEPFPLEELDQHGDELADAAGLKRIRQLSFDVGGQEPNRASLKTSVDVLIPRELTKGSQVRITIATADGEALINGLAGKVVAVTFEDQFDKDGILVGTERVHKVKLGI